MTKQGRSESGKFTSKSTEPRQVRTIRLTDSVWAKLGEFAESQGVTRADLIEEWAKQPPKVKEEQLDIFRTHYRDSPCSQEMITADTRKTGAKLAHRIGVTSGAITNWYRDGRVPEKTREHDPDHIAWEREPGTRKYRPIL